MRSYLTATPLFSSDLLPGADWCASARGSVPSVATVQFTPFVRLFHSRPGRRRGASRFPTSFAGPSIGSTTRSETARPHGRMESRTRCRTGSLLVRGLSRAPAAQLLHPVGHHHLAVELNEWLFRDPRRKSRPSEEHASPKLRIGRRVHADLLCPTAIGSTPTVRRPRRVRQGPSGRARSPGHRRHARGAGYAAHRNRRAARDAARSDCPR